MEQGKQISATMSPLVDFDAVCQKVRAAFEPARLYAVSLHDATGDILWLTESSMGPDEHNAVREAFEAFPNADAPPILDFDLGDSRSAVLFRAINSQRLLVGAIMVVMDSRGLKQGGQGPARLMNPKLQRALTDFAGMRPEVEPKTVATPAPAAGPRPAIAPSPAAAPRPSATAQPATAPRPSAAAQHATAPRPSVAAQSATAPSASRHAPAATGDSPAQVAPDRRPAQTIPPEIDRLHAAMRRTPIALHVQRLVPLTKGSHLKRYEVLLRSKSDDSPNVAPHAMLKAAVENGLGSMIDRRVVTELIGWLVHHPDVWRKQAVLFSVNLTSTALLDEHFIKFVELCLTKSSLPKAMIAFEVDVQTAMQLGDKVASVATALHRLGCPMVLDDFGLRTECFDLLRLPSVRYIKLASEITAKMRSDKLAQAAITAVVQMARVLGMHTVAKRTETAAEQEWLTALGVDFIQSNALSPPVAIDSLARIQNPPPSALTK